MTQPPRVRYFPGPQTWALAQAAYLQGESAGSIARRLNLTVNAIRKRAARKGWTRTQHAQALKRVEHPAIAMTAILTEIARAAHEGRFDDVAEMTRTAEGLVRALRAAPPPPPQEPSLQARNAWRKQESIRLEREWGVRGRQMAKDLLSERGHLYADGWAASALRWRLEHLGPEQNALDYAEGVRGGWAYRYWNEEGQLWPLPQPVVADEQMQRQHRVNCAAKRREGTDYEGGEKEGAAYPRW